MQHNGYVSIVSVTGNTKAPAVITNKAGEWVIEYEEPAAEWAHAKTRATVNSLDEPSLTVSRHGEVASTLVFAEEKHTIGTYEMEQGRVTLAIYTKSVNIAVSDKELHVTVSANIEGDPMTFDMLVTWT